MAFGRQVVKEAAEVQDAQPAEDPSELARGLVRDYLIDLEEKGSTNEQLAVAREAGEALIRYVGTLERTGASYEVVQAAATAARDIVAETVGLH